MSAVRELKVNKLKVKIYDSRSEMGQNAADDVAAAIDDLLGERDSLNMIFAAAPSQNEFLSALSQKKDLEWNRINAFHMDEYVGLPEKAPQSFGHFLHESIFKKLPFKQVFYINGATSDPQQECDRYSNLLAQHPPDIVCMGIGENGHIAFNDPHVADFKDPRLVKVVELSEASRRQQVHDGCFPDIEAVPIAAITLTIPALVHAGLICCIVPGKQKAEAVSNTLNREVREKYPSTILKNHDSATLYIDRDSSSKIEL
ncbi:MAG: 6-phosphogluconolactonase [Chitinophagaceae bacterium]|nr:6-phosphogluconolactonase [Chitinophagaceae bacterium]